MQDFEKKLSLAFSAADNRQQARVSVVAEIGVNHDGDAALGRLLIDSAAAAGVDAVKFQYFHPDRLLSNQAELAGYQQGQAANQRELLGKLAMPIDVLAGLVSHAKVCGLAAVVTPFSLADPAELADLGLDAIKTASPDAVNGPLLEACAAMGLPMLISTGTCSLDELEPAAALLRGHDAGGAMLHCVSSYPTPMGRAQLGGILAMRGALGLPIGYSDHTRGLQTGALAVMAGAVVIEKHLTHDRTAKGPDHAASLDGEQMKQYVANIREAQSAMGLVLKDVSEVERDVRRVSRQSVCVVSDLPAGHVLTDRDLTVKRPGTGLPASTLASLVGKSLAKAVKANDLLDASDLVDKMPS
ncbi:MAG: N-acetylneuraminate synthase family protein [Phycisphaeraceae bacterium]